MRFWAIAIMGVLFCLLSAAPVISDSHDPERIMPQEVMRKLNAGERIIFLDTRTAAARGADNQVIPNSILIENVDTVRRVVEQTPKDSLVVTYCT